MIDYYSRIYNNKSSILGKYDPLECYVSYNNNIEHNYFYNRFLNATAENIESRLVIYHENFHWWQAIGSTIGFIMSLIPHLQTLFALNAMRQIKCDLLKKPLFLSSNKINDINLNKLVSTWFDIEFAYLLLDSPLHYESSLKSDNFFKSQGHSYFVLIKTLLLKINTYYGIKIFDIDRLDLNFHRLEATNAEEFVFCKNIHASRLGTHELMECQSKIFELQILNNYSEKPITISDAKNLYNFNGVYSYAFDI